MMIHFDSTYSLGERMQLNDTNPWKLKIALSQVSLNYTVLDHCYYMKIFFKFTVNQAVEKWPTFR